MWQRGGRRNAAGENVRGSVPFRDCDIKERDCDEKEDCFLGNASLLIEVVNNDGATGSQPTIAR
jgi:hypothetical protein